MLCYQDFTAFDQIHEDTHIYGGKDNMIWMCGPHNHKKGTFYAYDWKRSSWVFLSAKKRTHCIYENVISMAHRKCATPVSSERIIPMCLQRHDRLRAADVWKGSLVLISQVCWSDDPVSQIPARYASNFQHDLNSFLLPSCDTDWSPFISLPFFSGTIWFLSLMLLKLHNRFKALSALHWWWRAGVYWV